MPKLIDVTRYNRSPRNQVVMIKAPTKATTDLWLAATFVTVQKQYCRRRFVWKTLMNQKQNWWETKARMGKVEKHETLKQCSFYKKGLLGAKMKFTHMKNIFTQKLFILHTCKFIYIRPFHFYSHKTHTVNRIYGLPSPSLSAHHMTDKADIKWFVFVFVFVDSISIFVNLFWNFNYFFFI